MPPSKIHKTVHSVICLFNVPKVDPRFVGSEEVLHVMRHAQRVQSVFFAGLIGREVLAYFLLTDCLRLRQHQSLSFVEHFGRCDLLADELVF